MKNARLTTGISALFLLFSTHASAESLRYEKVFSQISVPDNRLIFIVEEGGQVTMHRPEFMTHAGQYEWQLSSAELDSLWQSIQPQALAAVDDALLERNLNQRKSQELVEVSDSDITHIEWRADRASAPHVINVTGAVGWFMALPDQEQLGQLVTAEERIHKAMLTLLAGEGAR